MKLKDYREFMGLDRPQAVSQIKNVAKQIGSKSKVSYRRYFWWEVDVVSPNDDLIQAIDVWSGGMVGKNDFTAQGE